MASVVPQQRLRAQQRLREAALARSSLEAAFIPHASTRAMDELMAEAADRPIVMGIALHPYLVGWPHRARHLRRALAHIATRGGEADGPWLTTAGAIAAYAASLPPGSIVGDAAAAPAG